MVSRSSFNYVVIAKYFTFIAIVTVIFVLHARDWLWPCVNESLPNTKYTIETIEQHRDIVNKFLETRKVTLAKIWLWLSCVYVFQYIFMCWLSDRDRSLAIDRVISISERMKCPCKSTKWALGLNSSTYKSLLPTHNSGSKIKSFKNLYQNCRLGQQKWVTSNLGAYLFKHTSIQSNAIFSNKSVHFYNVLIWKHWNWLKRRHTDGFRDHENNPLYGCSVTNCRFSGDLDFTSADAVVVHIQKGVIPNIAERNPLQLWIFWVDESPMNAFSLAKKRPTYMELSNIFNWSMTYRTDSDVPIPYGRTVPLPYPKANNVTISILKDLVPFWSEKRSDILATILISNCYPSRMSLLSELMKYLNVDIYGGCSKNEYMRKRCPGHFRSDCKVLSRYLFYIVMENSKCRQYLTEKSFHHAYGKGAIPVFVGPFIEDCNTLLPPNSYLHIENFKSPEHLAEEINSIGKNVTKLLSYHAWRNDFEVVNEHGYFGTRSSQMCRICEALNYNQRTQKMYGVSDIRRYIDPEIQCL